jgi:hypothetical protein
MKEKEKNKKGGKDLTPLKKKEHPEIKTDLPLSEKDEVKQAEEKLKKM